MEPIISAGVENAGGGEGHTDNIKLMKSIVKEKKGCVLWHTASREGHSAEVISE